MQHVSEPTSSRSRLPVARHRGTLDDFLAAGDIVPLPTLSDAGWNRLRRETGRMLTWRFCTLRNLWVHRGHFERDAMGFAWGGIYRTLLAGSIVATALIESIRRGLAVGGVAFASPRGRELGERICTVLYQVAGSVGLRRVPRDLAAHERVRDAYDRRLREHPPSPRVQRLARETARRIVSITAALADEPVPDHVRRHLDADTAAYLFPTPPAPVPEAAVGGGQGRGQGPPTMQSIEAQSGRRQITRQRSDVAALERAYHEAPSVNTDDPVDDRLIGAILLHAIDAGDDVARPLERRTVDLAAGEPLIRQGETVGEMDVLLSATAPLVVLHRAEDSPEPLQVATLAAPTVLGEIGMWRGQPAVATVLSREPNRLDTLVIDAGRFESLKHESGFRAATAAEVQRRLSLNTSLVGRLLEDAAARTGDPRLTSISQLFGFLTGDSHVALDAVVELSEEATPAECVEALRTQVDAVLASGGRPADLERYLGHVVATIG